MEQQRKSGFVAVAGRPNAGKSTLINTLLGTNLSIVTPKAQTTRERVHGVLTQKEGQIVFIDTPGIHRAKPGGINEFMISEVETALDGPDLIWYIVDPKSGLKHEERVLEILRGNKTPVVLILSKSDLKTAVESDLWFPQLQERCRELGIAVVDVVRISAMKKRGVKELLQTTWARLPVGPFHFEDEDQLSDRPTRFFVAEKIREQILLCLGEELPYACAIHIEKYDESAKPPRIEAIIYVERDSQKGMVVGAAGKKIKEIGMNSRKEIEAFLGEKVFLGLNVKVLKDWSKDAKALERLGYHLPKKKK